MGRMAKAARKLIPGKSAELASRKSSWGVGVRRMRASEVSHRSNVTEGAVNREVDGA